MPRVIPNDGLPVSDYGSDGPSTPPSPSSHPSPSASAPLSPASSASDADLPQPVVLPPRPASRASPLRDSDTLTPSPVQRPRSRSERPPQGVVARRRSDGGLRSRSLTGSARGAGMGRIPEGRLPKLPHLAHLQKDAHAASARSEVESEYSLGELPPTYRSADASMVQSGEIEDGALEPDASFDDVFDSTFNKPLQLPQLGKPPSSAGSGSQAPRKSLKYRGPMAKTVTDDEGHEQVVSVSPLKGVEAPAQVRQEALDEAQAQAQAHSPPAEDDYAYEAGFQAPKEIDNADIVSVLSLNSAGPGGRPYVFRDEDGLATNRTSRTTYSAVDSYKRGSMVSAISLLTGEQQEPLADPLAEPLAAPEPDSDSDARADPNLDIVVADAADPPSDIGSDEDGPLATVRSLRSLRSANSSIDDLRPVSKEEKALLALQEQQAMIARMNYQILTQQPWFRFSKDRAKDARRKRDRYYVSARLQELRERDLLMTGETNIPPIGTNEGNDPSANGDDDDDDRDSISDWSELGSPRRTAQSRGAQQSRDELAEKAAMNKQYEIERVLRGELPKRSMQAEVFRLSRKERARVVEYQKRRVAVVSDEPPSMPSSSFYLNRLRKQRRDDIGLALDALPHAGTFSGKKVRIDAASDSSEDEFDLDLDHHTDVETDNMTHRSKRFSVPDFSSLRSADIPPASHRGSVASVDLLPAAAVSEHELQLPAIFEMTDGG